MIRSNTESDIGSINGEDDEKSINKEDISFDYEILMVNIK